MKKVKVNGKEYEVPEGYELIIKGDEVIIQEKKDTGKYDTDEIVESLAKTTGFKNFNLEAYKKINVAITVLLSLIFFGVGVYILLTLTKEDKFFYINAFMFMFIPIIIIIIAFTGKGKKK